LSRESELGEDRVTVRARGERIAAAGGAERVHTLLDPDLAAKPALADPAHGVESGADGGDPVASFLNAGAIQVGIVQAQLDIGPQARGAAPQQRMRCGRLEIEAGPLETLPGKRRARPRMAQISGDRHLGAARSDRRAIGGPDELELARLHRSDHRADREPVVTGHRPVDVEAELSPHRPDRSRAPIVDQHASVQRLAAGADQQDVAAIPAFQPYPVDGDAGDVAGQKQLALEVGGPDRTPVDEPAKQMLDIGLGIAVRLDLVDPPLVDRDNQGCIDHLLGRDLRRGQAEARAPGDIGDVGGERSKLGRTELAAEIGLDGRCECRGTQYGRALHPDRADDERREGSKGAGCALLYARCLAGIDGRRPLLIQLLSRDGRIGAVDRRLRGMGRGRRQDHQGQSEGGDPHDAIKHVSPIARDVGGLAATS